MRWWWGPLCTRPTRIFIVLAHWNSPRVDVSLHSETLLWFRAAQSFSYSLWIDPMSGNNTVTYMSFKLYIFYVVILCYWHLTVSIRKIDLHHNDTSIYVSIYRTIPDITYIKRSKWTVYSWNCMFNHYFTVYCICRFLCCLLA